MDIEQLKLILDLVKGTADSAVWLAVLYFFLPILKSILFIGGWLLVIPILLRGIKDIIGVATGEYMKELRTILGVGSFGTLTNREAREIVSEVRSLKQQNNTDNP